MNYEIYRWFLTEMTRNPSQGDSERLLIWFSPLWSLALWMGKMSYYETPECALLCSRLKGMLWSVRGSPLICEMLCAWSKDQALMLTPVTSRFCQKCLVQQAEGISHGGSLYGPQSSHIYDSVLVLSLFPSKGCILITNSRQDTGSRSVSPQLTLAPHHWTEQR